MFIGNYLLVSPLLLQSIFLRLLLSVQSSFCQIAGANHHTNYQLQRFITSQLRRNDFVNWPTGKLLSEDKEETSEPFEQQQHLLLNGPCLTANCKTWITITIPSELVGIPPGIGISSSNSGGIKEEENGVGSISKQRLVIPPKPSPSIESKPSMPPFPPKPMPQPLPHRSRGSPSSKNRPRGSTSATIDTSSTISSATTKAYPPDFVFSTKWILPVDGRSKNNTGSTIDNLSSISTYSSTQPTSSGRGIESLPFTIRPKSPTAVLPKNRPSVKRPANSMPSKPWTHSSSSNSPKDRSQSGKQASRPPTPDTTIEQAAIWASTELIDAIREALAKFRATLNKNDRQSSQLPYIQAADNPEEAERELHAQLQSAWETLRGTWLEHAVVDLAQQTDALARERHASERS